MRSLKVIRKFFLSITKVLDGISGITKIIIFFHLKVCERRNFDFCVFLRMCSMPVKNRFIKAEWRERTSSRRAPNARRAYYTSVKTQKNKSFSCFKKNFLITLRPEKKMSQDDNCCSLSENYVSEWRTNRLIEKLRYCPAIKILQYNNASITVLWWAEYLFVSP